MVAVQVGCATALSFLVVLLGGFSSFQAAQLDGQRPFAGKEANAAGSEETALPTSGEVQSDSSAAAQVATTAKDTLLLQSVGSARWTAAPESDNGMRRMLAAVAPPPVVKPSSGKWSATQPQAVTASQSPSNATAVLLPYLQNSYRSRHQFTPALKWNATIAAGAQAFSNKCQFAYSGTSGVGEYVGLGYYFKDQVFDAAASWANIIFGAYSGIKNYDFTKPGFNATTAAFTQMVWASTTTIGCGATKCPTAYPNIDSVIYICHYTPPGNVFTTSAFASNVFPLV